MPWIARTSLLALAALALGSVGWMAVGPRPALLGVAYLAAATPWLVAIDLREHRLPNELVLPGVVGGLLTCAGEWAMSGRPPLGALAAGLCYPAFLLVLSVIGGMGMGDVKLGAALGLASWTPAVAVIGPVVAFLVGGLVALVMILVGQPGRRIAFGPYLLGGFWLAVVFVVVAGASAGG